MIDSLVNNGSLRRLGSRLPFQLNQHRSMLDTRVFNISARELLFAARSPAPLLRRHPSPRPTLHQRPPGLARTRSRWRRTGSPLPPTSHQAHPRRAAARLEHAQSRCPRIQQSWCSLRAERARGLRDRRAIMQGGHHTQRLEGRTTNQQPKANPSNSPSLGSAVGSS